jgi:quercetin dioxygenase-like cupin family protein
MGWHGSQQLGAMMSEQATGPQFTFVDNAVSMAKFEDGRVKPVSVLKATGANVVIFAFDAGAVLREHTALQPVLLQSLEGSLTIDVAGQQFMIGPGDLFHIEPHVPHSVSTQEQARLQLTVLLIDSPGPSKVPLTD